MTFNFPPDSDRQPLSRNRGPDARIALSRRRLAVSSGGMAALPCDTDWSFFAAYLMIAVLVAAVVALILVYGACP